MSRFHWILTVAIGLSGVAWYLRSLVLFAGIVLIIGVVVGAGVALPQMKLFGPFLCGGKTDRRYVALTFDDGPDPRSTIPLLELLHRMNVKAAFFCIGKRVAAYPEIARQMVREGHLVENHSYAHSNATNFFGVARLRAELAEAQSEIQKCAGVKPGCFRPPMGLSNPRIFRVAGELGLKVVGWSARGFDTRIQEPNRIVNRIVGRLKPGAIILLHDGNIPPERLLTTVKTLLDRVRGLGYEVVRLDRLLS